MNSEVAQVLDIIQKVKIHRLGYWDGCCCSHFSLRGINVSIGCGKGPPQAVWVGSGSLDYAGADLEKEFAPIMDEVIAQLGEFSNRGGTFARHFEEDYPR